MKPTVTIVTPAFNAARYLGETIDSVQSQAWRDWEWIIVDDGSTDETAPLLEARARGDKRIRIIHQENQGVSAARNRGLDCASGSTIALLDADDTWRPDNLQRKTAALAAEPSLLFVYSNMHRYIQRTGETIDSPPGKPDNLLENLLLWNGEVIPSACSNVVLRRSAVDAGLRFDRRFSTAADIDFAFRLAVLGPGRLLEERLFTYRVLPQSMSRDLLRAERELIAVWEKAATLGLFRDRTFRRRCFAQLYLVLAGSWWVDGRDTRRALPLLLKAVLSHPRALAQLGRKVVRRLVSVGR